MGDKFDSFDESKLGAFIESPLGVRGVVSTLVFVGNITYVDSAENIFDVGKYNATADKLELFGLNEGFDLGNPPAIKILEYGSTLYICGGFIWNNDHSRDYRKIARYDNDDGIWKTLSGSNDLTSNSTMTDMCLFDGKLIVCGNSSHANNVPDTNAIAAWDGSNWSSVGGDGTNRVLGTLVHRCLAYDGLLYATGNFLTAPDETPGVRKIKKWDGVSWESLIHNSQEPFFNRPNALEVFQDTLVMAGSGYVYSWDGTAFTALSTNVKRGFSNGVVFGSTIYKGDLIICGNFTSIDGVTMNGVARYDGLTWSALGTGITVSGFWEVSDVHVDNGVLYACGDFTTNGDGDAIRGIVHWNNIDEVWEDTGIRTDFIGNNGNISMASFSGSLTVPEP